MIDALLLPGVVAAEAFDDNDDDFALLPAETSLVERAVDKRRTEFTTARGLARRALTQIGVEPAPILRGDKGQPLWPRGVVGSLTHCDGYRAAVVAHKLQCRSVGIDAEPHGPLPDGVLDHVTIPAERDVLATRGAEIHWDRLLFCAKEATYKTWFPLTGRWLGFEDAHITFTRDAADPDDGHPGDVHPGAVHTGGFHSELLVDGSVTDGGTPLLSFDGRWRVERGLVVTSICL